MAKNNAPSYTLAKHGSHMLRAGLHGMRVGDPNRKIPNRQVPSQSIVGLGIFAPRGSLECSDGACCDPRCNRDEEVWAVWLWNGKIVVLPFCLAHAEEHLLLDEIGEARKLAAAVRDEKRATTRERKLAARRAARASARTG
jgi:hypothetical protein